MEKLYVLQSLLLLNPIYQKSLSNNEHELSTDKIVMQKLVDKGISPQRIKDVMKHSPQIEGKSPAEKAIKLQQFSKQLEKIPSLSRGLER